MICIIVNLISVVVASRAYQVKALHLQQATNQPS